MNFNVLLRVLRPLFDLAIAVHFILLFKQQAGRYRQNWNACSQESRSVDFIANKHEELKLKYLNLLQASQHQNEQLLAYRHAAASVSGMIKHARPEVYDAVSKKEGPYFDCMEAVISDASLSNDNGRLLFCESTAWLMCRGSLQNLKSFLTEKQQWPHWLNNLILEVWCWSVCLFAAGFWIGFGQYRALRN